MKAIGLRKARTRLERAEAAFQRLLNTSEYPKFEEAWSDLLLNLNSIYSVLEQSSHGNPKAEAWFGRKKHERKKDPLLAYLHQARNADEHGIEPVTRFQQGGVGFGGTSGSAFVGGVTFENGVLSVGKVIDLDGGKPYVKVRHPTVQLVTVKNTIFNDVFDPPRSHREAELPDQAPITVAKLALEYHEQLIAEASAFG